MARYILAIILAPLMGLVLHLGACNPPVQSVTVGIEFVAVEMTPTQEFATFTPLPTVTPTPTETPLLRQYINPGPNVINLRAGPGTSFSDVGDLQIDERVGVRDGSRTDGWIGVCVYLNDGECVGSYWIYRPLLREYFG